MRYDSTTDLEMFGLRTDAYSTSRVECDVPPSLARPGLFGD